jgi:peroxiredoxin
MKVGLSSYNNEHEPKQMSMKKIHKTTEHEKNSHSKRTWNKFTNQMNMKQIHMANDHEKKFTKQMNMKQVTTMHTFKTLL